jgi:hypothetical protein
VKSPTMEFCCIQSSRRVAGLVLPHPIFQILGDDGPQRS